MPRRPQLDELSVELDADPPAHAHHHGLAFHGLQAPVEVVDEVSGDHAQASLGPDNRLELRPFGLQLLLAFGLFLFGDLLELLVDPGLLLLGQVELRQSALVVDGDRGLVRHRALDVVDVDVVTEDGACVAVVKLHRRAGERDERRVRQCVTHVTGEAVDKPVLAPVGLVGDDHDVPPV